MKLIRFGEPGKEKTGIIRDGKWFDTSAFGEDYNEAFFESDGLNRLSAFLADNVVPQADSSGRLGCPLGRPSKPIPPLRW